MSIWYKSSNALIDDSILKLVSKKAGVKHYVTVVTFHSLLERCSKNNASVFGNEDTIADEISIQTELQAEDVSAVVSLLRTYGKIKDNTLTNWDKYQFNSSSERVRKWREKKKVETNETLQNVPETQIRIDKIRLDKKEEVSFNKDTSLREILPKITRENFSYDSLTDQQKNFFKIKTPDVDIPDLIEDLKNWCLSKGKTYSDYYAALQNWAKKEQARLNITLKKGNYENRNAATRTSDNGYHQRNGSAPRQNNAEIIAAAKQRVLADINRTVQETAKPDSEPAKENLIEGRTGESGNSSN